MAGKIVVTHPEIKGEAGFTKISVESAIQKARASATFSDPSASVSFVKIEAESAYQFAKGLIEWADIRATEMVLDPFSLNQYPVDLFEVLESASISTEKAFLDAFGFSDSHVMQIAKAIDESFELTETVDIVLIVLRDFSDSTAISDVAVLDLDKSVSNSISFTDSQLKEINKGNTETLSFLEGVERDLSKPIDDATSIADSFGRVVAYVRAASSAFTLDEVVSISQNFGVDKTNILSLTDSFSYEMRAGHNSVLNASALNTYTLNS